MRGADPLASQPGPRGHHHRHHRPHHPEHCARHLPPSSFLSPTAAIKGIIQVFQCRYHSSKRLHNLPRSHSKCEVAKAECPCRSVCLRSQFSHHSVTPSRRCWGNNSSSHGGSLGVVDWTHRMLECESWREATGNGLQSLTGEEIEASGPGGAGSPPGCPVSEWLSQKQPGPSLYSKLERVFSCRVGPPSLH